MTPEKLSAIFDDVFPARYELLKLLVNQNSYTTHREGVHKIQSMLEDSFWEIGLKTERVSCPKRADILVARNSFDAKHGAACVDPILLVGHADTVHPPQSSFQRWSINGDEMSGPGVLDMKGGLMHIFLVLDIFKKLGVLDQIPLKILVNSCEENSTPTSAKLVQQIAAGAREALVFEIGRAEGGIVTQRKGILECWVHVAGKAAHSGNSFGEGINAILPLCQIAVHAAALTNLEKDITVNVAQLQGGQQFCIIPEKASLGIEIRAGTLQDMDDTFAQIQSFVAQYPHAELVVDTKTAPLNKIKETDELFALFSSCAAAFDFQVKELPRVGGLSDANLIGSLGIPTLDALGPYGTGAHTDLEKIYLSSVKPRVLAVAYYLLKKLS
jgi:glutamate carboxypeptidase